MTGFPTILAGRAMGPLSRRSPGARIASGVIVFAACMAAPAGSAGGVAYLLATAAAWVAMCGMPVRVAVRLAGILATVLLPLGLVALVPGADGEPAHSPLATLAAIAVRGVAATLVAVATASALGPGDFVDGLASLRVPGPAAAILAQIVRQAGILSRETLALAAAIRVRGGTSGLGAALAIAQALPRTWLPRVGDRAARAALAMELRAFDGVSPFPPAPWSCGDALLMAILTAWAGLGLGLRAGGG